MSHLPLTNALNSHSVYGSKGYVTAPARVIISHVVRQMCQSACVLNLLVHCICTLGLCRCMLQACDVVSQVVKCVSAIYGQDGTGPLSTARPFRLHMPLGLTTCFRVNCTIRGTSYRLGILI